jgi:hypothetical protein
LLGLFDLPPHDGSHFTLTGSLKNGDARSATALQVFVNIGISGRHFFGLALCVVQREGIKTSIRSAIATDFDDAEVNCAVRFLFEEMHEVIADFLMIGMRFVP